MSSEPDVPTAPDVLIYTRQFCGYCLLAKRLLDDRGVAYGERDATGRPEVRAEMIQRSRGGYTFPQVFVGETHVGGYRELAEWVVSGALARALAGGRNAA